MYRTRRGGLDRGARAVVHPRVVISITAECFRIGTPSWEDVDTIAIASESSRVDSRVHARFSDKKSWRKYDFEKRKKKKRRPQSLFEPSAATAACDARA